MKLLQWNIQWGLGVDGRCDLARIAADIRSMGDPDVICLQELSDGMPDLKDNDGSDQFAAMARLFPGFVAIEGVGVDVPGLGPGLPRRRFGNMLLSRLPVGQVMRHVLPWEADATPNMPRVLIEAVVIASSGPIRVMTTHLEWSSVKLRAAQVAGIREAHRTACERVATPPSSYYGPFMPQPGTTRAILTGDFNMRPEDPVKHAVEAPFAGDIPALVDAWTATRPGEPHPPSFCIVDQSHSPPHCCDFVFVTQNLVPHVRDVAYFTENRSSDHQPVLLTLDA